MSFSPGSNGRAIWLVVALMLDGCTGTLAGSTPAGSGGVSPTGHDAGVSADGGSSGAGAGSAGGSAAGGAPGIGGMLGAGGSSGMGQGGAIGIGGAGAGGHTGSGGAGVGAAGGSGNCNFPSPVTFQRDLQPFLTATCGGGNGCHVIDSASTVGSGGYDHAYDWITAGAHPSSCPGTPTPRRFQVVLDVIAGANPATCSKSRIMPPQNETGTNLRKPLTSCQVAMLQAWLDEPLVTQPHRVDDTDPAGTAPFPMPPFN
jgi:hypothetical protein